MHALLALVLSALLVGVPAASSPAEGTIHALEDITYTVQWVYYDGYVAEINVLQTPNKPDVALIDALMYDPGNISTEPMSVAAGEAANVIGSYCEMAFYYDSDDALTLGPGGGGSFIGRNVDSYAWVSLPMGVSPDSLDVAVSIGVRTRQEPEYDEFGGFIITMPKEDKPLIEEALDLDLGATVVKHITVSRTPSMLVLNIYHEPASEEVYPSFTVYPTDGAILQQRSTHADHDPQSGMAHVERTFSLAEGEPVPAALRLHYDGAPEKGLLADLQAGTVSILGQ